MNTTTLNKKLRRREQVRRGVQKHRARFKENISSLREKARKLEDELEKQKRAHFEYLQRLPIKDTWKEKAQIEKTKRKASEQENANLKKLINQQRDITQHLYAKLPFAGLDSGDKFNVEPLEALGPIEPIDNTYEVENQTQNLISLVPNTSTNTRILDKLFSNTSMNTSMKQMTLGQFVNSLYNYPFILSNQNCLEQYIVYLQSMYTRMIEAFDMGRLNHHHRDISNIELISEPHHNNQNLDIWSARQRVYHGVSFDQVGEIMWNFYNGIDFGVSSHKLYEIEVIEKLSDDIVYWKFTHQFSVKYGFPNCQQYMITKRFIEGNRYSLITMTIDKDLFNFNPKDILWANSRLWISIEKIESYNRSTTEPVIIVRLAEALRHPIENMMQDTTNRFRTNPRYIDHIIECLTGCALDLAMHVGGDLEMLIKLSYPNFRGFQWGV